MKAICGCDCDKCPNKPNCKGCDVINGCPHGGNCIALDLIKKNGMDSYVLFKQTLINEINDLHIKDMPIITDLNLLVSSWVNLEYPLPNGGTVKFLKDNDVVLGNQVEHLSKDTNRCFGVIGTEEFILICEYGEFGKDPCIITYKKR